VQWFDTAYGSLDAAAREAAAGSPESRARARPEVRAGGGDVAGVSGLASADVCVCVCVFVCVCVCVCVC
jgi:hypothetical protein